MTNRRPWLQASWVRVSLSVSMVVCGWIALLVGCETSPPMATPSWGDAGRTVVVGVARTLLSDAGTSLSIDLGTSCPDATVTALPDVVESGPPTSRDAADATLADASPRAVDATITDATLRDGPAMETAACVGLACQQTCASTTVKGKVYDPAGINGLYNILVYVPSAPLDPIPTGPSCTQCQLAASGSPLTQATTHSDGTFTLTNLPSGVDIPIVLQAGKWRRHLTLPSVTACATNTPPDGFFRLPRAQHETSADDNIPLIALTTGCDGVECFFRGRIGLLDSEFTGPGGAGRVHVYKSANDDGQQFPGGAGNANDFWANEAEWMKYDIVFDACECETFDRGGAGSTNVGYANFLHYLNAGGRAFTTHYFYNFFANESQCDPDSSEDVSDCFGQGSLPAVAAWEGNTGQSFAPDFPDCPNDPAFDGTDGGLGGSCVTIDTSVPKGAAFASWYQQNSGKLGFGGGETYGHVGLTDIRTDVGALAQPLVAAGTATPWLYAGDLGDAYDTYYFSVNTPVGTLPCTQCGRAIFSDVHLDDPPPTGGVFPSYCATNPSSNDHAPNELALEFLFFDLASCVQDERKEPVAPPPK